MSAHSCVICGETKGFKLCSRCGLVGYCSVEHQKQDWKQQHKNNCKKQDKPIPTTTSTTISTTTTTKKSDEKTRLLITLGPKFPDSFREKWCRSEGKSGIQWQFITSTIDPGSCKYRILYNEFVSPISRQFQQTTTGSLTEDTIIKFFEVGLCFGHDQWLSLEMVKFNGMDSSVMQTDPAPMPSVLLLLSPPKGANTKPTKKKKLKSGKKDKDAKDELKLGIDVIRFQLASWQSLDIISQFKKIIMDIIKQRDTKAVVFIEELNLEPNPLRKSLLSEGIYVSAKSLVTPHKDSRCWVIQGGIGMRYITRLGDTDDLPNHATLLIDEP